MADTMEIEIKLGLPPSLVAQVEDMMPLLCGVADRVETKCLVSTYFDTRKCKLREAGISLRIREDNGRYIQTVKTEHAAANSFRRGEWEAEVEGASPDLDLAKRTKRSRLL